ncbi:carboxypeptidase-like regulatory domain-containing protein [Hymenobacter convexus]|uniref:carboxypeptidase-like regulatory domain-containing protein n=1 Tax=Hymenobacter sp. CA1UV-4 TaxID=3063782 RepID=UPI002712A3D2|nr:carboxypeptidase-like regulatory domain-containing protein [Hymenobacter sp. CA1UV-4]MDO7850712.1 carboxypeptidase-like regulatory domain-containing protein [Hymenobacter sp. CA1UV-4]
MINTYFIPPVWERRLVSAFRLLCCLCLLSACQEDQVVPAYYGTVTGTVLDGRTNLPVANASVTTNPATSSYLTNAQGKFQIDNVPAGRLAITVTKTDYQQVSANVTVYDTQVADVSLVLTKSSSAIPTAPTRPSPANQATGQPTTVVLAWHPVNATASDSLRYDVLLFESNNVNATSLLTNSKDTTVTAANLKYGTTYYWQVTVRNPAGGSARGPVWNFQTASLPNNRYLYARTVAGNTDIYSSDGAGNNLLRLTSAATAETAPQLSPNRDLIAYASNASGQYQLYTMNRDGSNPRQITTLSVEGYNNPGIGYRWSPDGAQLVYAHYDQLYRINRDGTGLTLLATAPTGRHFRECDWTVQNGGRLVVQTVGQNVYDAELYLYNVDGSNPTLFLGNLAGRLDSPNFSLDGLSVLYSRDVAGFNDPGGRQLDAHVFIRRIDGTSTLDITANTTGIQGKILGTNDIQCRFSPDGFRVIFVNRVNDDLTPPEVWTMDLDGRNRSKLFSNAFWPDWK